MNTAKNTAFADPPPKFTSLELLALSALIDPMPLYGIPLDDVNVPLPDAETEAHQFNQIVQGLTSKNILDANQSFTPSSIPLIEVLRTYKYANEYIFLNEMRLSKNRDISISVIAPQPDGTYSFFRTRPPILLQALAAHMPWLDHQESYPPSDPLTYPDDAWLEEHIDYSMSEDYNRNNKIKDIIILRQHRAETPKALQSHIYYRQASHSYKYDEHTRQRSILPSQEIKQEIQDMITYTHPLYATQ